MVASAPPAIALVTAKKPESRPRTPTTIARRWAVAVSFMRSMTATAVFRAVSTPMENSVRGMSLSIVAGTPTVGMPRLWSSRPPERLPPPPITTSPSTPASRSFSRALSLPSSPSSNSEERPVPKAVPPCWTKPHSSRRSTGLMLPSSSP